MSRPVRFVALIALLAIAGCGPSPDAQLVSRLQHIQAAFDAAETADDFLHVAAQYQELIDAGFVSGAVLFNQGNAFMRARQRGRAVACYRQAQRYLPRNPYVDANLRYALGDQAPRRPPLLGYVLFWQNWISYPGKFQMLGFVACLAFSFGLLALLVRPKIMWRRLAWATLLVALVFSASVAYDWYRHTQIRHGVVIRDNVVARKGNGEDYQQAFNQPLREGAEFTVQELRGDWLLVRLGPNQEGWVRSGDVITY